MTGFNSPVLSYFLSVVGVMLHAILDMKHLLSIEELDAGQLESLISLGIEMKRTRQTTDAVKPLAGQTWAMVFTKSSTRTRVSFEVGIRELGGDVMFLSGNDLQLGRGEPVKDTARVMGRMVHGIVIRTFAQQDVEDFAKWGQIPVVNALTDEEHPCQILADLMTVKEQLGTWEAQKIVFVGDGDNNMSRSWMWAAKYLGFEFVVASPKDCQPPASFLEKLNASNVSVTDDVRAAMSGASVVNTDVWLSMGQEGQLEKEQQFSGFQVNESTMSVAKEGAIVLHCLPAYRDKEISEETLEKHAEVIFSQAENRLHAQKAVLATLQSS